MQNHEAHNHRRGASRKALTIAFVLTAGFMAAEVVGGVLANSLALLADAGHMVTDAASIGLALAAMWVGSRPASARHTFGLVRAEILSALTNAVLLWAIAGWVFYEAYHRFQSTPDIEAPLMLAVGAAGLAVNVIVAVVLAKAAGESLHVEGALLHVIGDLLGSVGVLIAAVLIALFGWTLADPIVSIVIGVLILISATRLLVKVVRVLMQGTPWGMDLTTLCQEMESVENVAGIHDIHAWTLTSGYNVLSAHVTTEATSAEAKQRLLRDLRQVAILGGMSHVTFQLEDSAEECEEETHHTPHDVTAF